MVGGMVCDLAGGTICSVVVVAWAGGALCGATAGWFDAVAVVGCGVVIGLRSGVLIRCCSLLVALPIGGR